MARPQDQFAELAEDAPQPVTEAAFVSEQLWHLLAAASKGVWERAALLTALAARIAEMAQHWTDTKEHRQLKALAAELTPPTTDPGEVERRWQHTLTTFESLTGPPRKRAFWKR
jgi:hypothetical protein